jgi:hypothetical protein
MADRRVPCCDELGEKWSLRLVYLRVRLWLLLAIVSFENSLTDLIPISLVMNVFIFMTAHV